MKTLAQQMAVYAAYHRNPVNRATHFIGVPIIVFSILLLLSLVRLPFQGLEFTAAMVLVWIVLGYYFALDTALAIAMTVVIGGLLIVAERMATSIAFGSSMSIFTVTFIGGWLLQLLGHMVEGRRPALVDNLFQIFVAPIFLMAEVFFALGYRRQIQGEVEVLLQAAETNPAADDQRNG